MKVLVSQSCPTLWDPLDCSLPRLLCPWNFPSKNTGVGSRSLLQGTFPTQELSPGLLHCRWILHQLSHQGSNRKSESGQVCNNKLWEMLGGRVRGCCMRTHGFQWGPFDTKVLPQMILVFFTLVGKTCTGREEGQAWPPKCDYLALSEKVGRSVWKYMSSGGSENRGVLNI